MKILFIGDTVGKAGRTIVHDHLKYLQEDYAVDLTILNCENAAAGFGVTPKIADELWTTLHITWMLTRFPRSE